MESVAGDELLASRPFTSCREKKKKKNRAVQLRLCAKGFTSRMCANMFLSYKPFFIQGSRRPYKGCRVSAREGSTASIPAV